MDILVCLVGRLVSDSLCYFFESEGYHVHVANDLADLHQKMSRLNPKITLISQHIYQQMDLTEISRIESSGTTFLALIAEDMDGIIKLNTLPSNIRGICHEKDGLDSIKECVSMLSRNQSYISRALNEIIQSEIKVRMDENLTYSESIIAELVLEGYNTHRISRQLNRSEETIKNHRKSIKRKLQINGGKSELIRSLKIWKQLRSLISVFNNGTI